MPYFRAISIYSPTAVLAGDALYLAMYPVKRKEKFTLIKREPSEAAARSSMHLVIRIIMSVD